MVPVAAKSLVDSSIAVGRSLAVHQIADGMRKAN